MERIQEQVIETTDVLAPAVTFAAPSQQLPSIIEIVTTGVNLDMKTVTTGVNLDHYLFGAPTIFHYCCGGICAIGRWFTSSFRKV